MAKGIELKIRDVYLAGRKMEEGEPFRGSEEAQRNVVRTLIDIAERVEAETADEHRKAG